MGKWYVVQVVSGLEKRARQNILENRVAAQMQEAVEDVIVPSEKVAEVKRGEQRVFDKRLWPGYVFVKMDLTEDSWTYVRNANGVLGFLGGGDPAPLTEDEVEKILNDLEDRQKNVVQKHRINVGDHVKIVDGVFVNFVGEVVEVSYEKGRLSALVSIFGRDTRVDDLEFWQVELVPKDVEHK